MGVKMEVKLLKSMTGFGVAQGSGAGCEISVKVRTLNGRFLECTVKVPSQFLELEGELRKRAQVVFQRGKVEIQIYLKVPASLGLGSQSSPTLNKEILEKYKKIYLDASYEIAGVHSSLTNTDANDILRRPGVISFPEDVAIGDSDLALKGGVPAELTGCLWGLVDEAFRKVIESRIAEGKEIQVHIDEILQSLQESIEKLRQLALPLVGNKVERLRSRIAEILQGVAVDESRIIQEAAVMADRYDIAEELQRFDAHVKAIRVSLQTGMDGKKLDFMCQELVREVNTIGSKAQHSEIQHTVVDLKGLIERLREQAQNIE
jgi:uncharacterized protein (TIGR00255 family)